MVETVGNARSLPLKGKELRKTNKPLMEKRRRARINTCLNQLKSLVLQAMNKDSSQYSKLEKADILEMTVNFLKAVPQQKTQGASQETASVMSKYSTGFNECASQVARYLDTCQVDNQVRSRVLNHLSQRVASVNTPQQSPDRLVAAPQQSLQPVFVQIPNTTQPIPGVHNNHGYPINTPVHTGPSPAGNHQGALIVMPSAVVVPTPVSVQQQQQQQQTWFHLQQQQQQQHFVMPISPASSISSSRGCSPVSMPSSSPVLSKVYSPHAVQASLVPTPVASPTEELWRPW